MACYPNKQLFDSCRPEYTNINIVYAPEGMVTEVTVDNLPEGIEIPVLVRDGTGQYVPYIVDGEQVVLTSENSSVIVEEGSYYQFDTSAVPTDADPCVVMSSETRSKPIEVTFDIGEDCDNPLFVNVCNGGDTPSGGIEIGFAPLGCVYDEDTGDLTGKVFTAETQSEDGSPATYRMVFVSTDGTVTDPYTGTWENCSSDISDDCVSCQTLIMCDQVNDPDPEAGTPWNVISIEEDVDDPEHVLHFSLSPVDDPSKVGVVTFRSTTAFNTGGCDNPDIDYQISNPSFREITLDEVAQEMHAFQFNMNDFDTFEPTYIPTGYPVPTRLGGTAYWTDTPGNNVNILPTESNGTGLLIWDNPPETIGIQVGNTGGGSSCSHVDFSALTLGTMNRSFLRTICRDCEGNVISVSDYDMDGITPYEPVGEVTVCTSSESETTNDTEEEWTSSVGSAFHFSPVGAGQTEAGLVSVSITNVGESNGLVYNSDIVPGQTITFTAYENPVTKEFVTLPAIPYDSTGTTLSITTQG